MARTTRVSTLPQAFSLIELLVVIGIIALLLALALPALGSARTHARKSDCLSDMHQVGLALTLYANDYDDRLPLPNWGPVAAAPGWL